MFKLIGSTILLLVSHGINSAYAQEMQPAPGYEISNFASASWFDSIDWDSLQGYPLDPQEGTRDGNPLDWQRAWIANDALHFYIGYKNYGDISTSWGQTIYIDTDKNSETGWQSGLPIGADYVIQGAHLFSYDGDVQGTVWQWNLVHNMGVSFFSDLMELKFKKTLLGNPDTFRLVFVGSNEPYGGTVEDLYPDNLYSKGLNNQFFSYRVATGGNSAPIAEEFVLSTRMDQPIEFTLYATDPDDDDLTYNITSDPIDSGVLQGTPPNLTFIPNPGYEGGDFFSFTVNDGQLDSEEALVAIDVRATGVNPVIYSNQVTNLTLDGDLSDWDTLQGFPEDRQGDVSFTGDNPIDFTDAAMAHNDAALFLYYENNSEDLNNIDDWTFNVFLDTDINSTTGFQDGMAIGSEYLLQGASLYRYDGDGSSWAWAYEGDVVRSVMQTQAEIMIDRVAIGDPQSIRIALIGDNLTLGGRMIDFYPDGIYNALRGYRFYEYMISDTIAIPQNTLTFQAASATPISGLIDSNIIARQPFANSTNDSGTITTGGGVLGISYLFLLLQGLILHRRKRQGSPR